MAPQFSSRTPISFLDREYALEIANAGSPNAYTLDRTILRQVRVMPDSSAIEHLWVIKPARFVSRTAFMHWKASGSPRLPGERRDVYKWAVPADAFSFTPQGAILTFQGIRRLPSLPAAVAEGFRKLLGGQTGPTSDAWLLRQYGFVLAVAPVSPRVRRALLGAMALLPGLSMCGRTIAGERPRVETFCIERGSTRTEVVLDPQNGLALAVRERLEEPAALYPNLAVGDLVDSDAFSLKREAQTRR